MDDDLLVDYGLIDLSGVDKRLGTFRSEIQRLVDLYHPEVINWENLKTNQNADTVRYLGEFTGVLREFCQTYNYFYNEAIPVSIRAKLCKVKTGKQGRGTKLDLAKTLCDRYGLEWPKKKKSNGKFSDEDVTSETHQFFNQTDAIGIGLFIYLTKYAKGS